MPKARKILQEDIKKAKDYLIIVEGRKDENALRKIGFEYIFVINETGRSLQEGMEIIKDEAGRRKICILTDFDKRGKMLFMKLKSGLLEIGVRMDNTLRGALLKCGVSHVEGISKFVEKD